MSILQETAGELVDMERELITASELAVSAKAMQEGASLAPYASQDGAFFSLIQNVNIRL